MAGILAIVEQRDGALRRISEEVVSAAANIADKLGGEVHALLAGGTGTAAAASNLGKAGAAKVFVLEHDSLKDYNADALSKAIAEQVKKGSYDVVVFGGSSFGKDIAPRVAAKLDVPLATDVTGVEVDGSDVVVTRPA